MHPVLAEFSVRGVTITLMAYTSFLAAALIAVLLIAEVSAARAGLPRARVLGVLLVSALAAAAGARVLNWIMRPDVYADDPSKLFTLRREGLALYGGILAASLAGYATGRLLRLDPWKLADLASPALGIGIALCRAGCFLNGCCFGKPSSVPWAVTPPADGATRAAEILLGTIGAAAASARPAHPLQLYEIAAALVCAAAAALVLRKRLPPGSALACFLGLFTAWRLVSLPILWRGSFSNHRMAILYSAILAACGLYMVVAPMRASERLVALEPSV